MNTKREFWKRNAMAVIGMLIFSAGINLFIVPANLYNGGVLGISQVLRTVLVRYLHVAAGTTDIAGIINMFLNIPLFALAYVFVGKIFLSHTGLRDQSDIVSQSDSDTGGANRAGLPYCEHHRWDFWRNRNRHSITVRGLQWRPGYRWNDLYQTV